jgi:hypothetical protein
MSVLVLDSVQQREKLSLAIGAINEVSNNAKETNTEFEKRINILLDYINDTRQLLNKRVDDVSFVLPKVAELARLAEVDADVLADMKQLIDLLLHLNRVMVTFWAKVSRSFAQHKVAKLELNRYKQVTDDVKELATDLNDRFFVLPEDKEFQELMQQLAAM